MNSPPHGSGIRCLLYGNLHCRCTIGEDSDNVNIGDTWYEEGAYPIVSTTYDEIPTTFLRDMILPVEYAEYPASVVWIENKDKVGAVWKKYTDQVIRLL